MTNTADFEVISNFSYRHPIVFFNQCLYLLSERTQLLEHYAFICYLQHVSTVSGKHQVDFTTTNMEKHTKLEALLSQLIYSNFVIPYKSILVKDFRLVNVRCVCTTTWDNSFSFSQNTAVFDVL
jgi:hypothetical protein